MKKLLSIILLALPVTVMASHFNGNDIRISSETWYVDKDDNLIIKSVGTDIRVIPADTGNPDVSEFEMFTPSDAVDHSWSIDFVGVQDSIKLVFISPEVVNLDYQYNYDTDTNVGFHFQDVGDAYPPITAVRASTSFAPKGFDPSLIRFDETIFT
ncbi:MAG: hypothetical protein H0A75_06830 [Candidatus Methanofishera endochildressiae]|uniref:Uncharacterized protein n=1 Tax=Candidatus Methanofishera endochildressiae TaxID=2738884 RepID=A0A7Z0MPF8_9GAMM|nr:hypothetical protein [Candidatus Methanofishera endochildressiae]